MEKKGRKIIVKLKLVLYTSLPPPPNLDFYDFEKFPSPFLFDPPPLPHTLSETMLRVCNHCKFIGRYDCRDHFLKLFFLFI